MLIGTMDGCDIHEEHGAEDHHELEEDDGDDDADDGAGGEARLLRLNILAYSTVHIYPINQALWYCPLIKEKSHQIS